MNTLSTKLFIPLGCALALLACSNKESNGGTDPGAGGGNAGGAGGGTGGGGTVSAPVARLPAVDPLDPALTLAGGPALELKVYGDDFVASSVVRWNGMPRATTFVSATELRAQLTAADLAPAGSSVVTVFTPAPRGGESQQGSFVVQDPAPALAAPPFTPSSAEAGGTAFTLVVHSTGFVSSSVGRWNGQARPTTYFSAVEVHIDVSNSDLVEGGVNLTVFTPAPGGGVTPVQLFDVRPRRGAFLRASLSTAGVQGNDLSWIPAVSATGRWVAFASDASNLVAADTWGVGDVFLRDTCVGAAGCSPSTTRLSVSRPSPPMPAS